MKQSVLIDVLLNKTKAISRVGYDLNNWLFEILI